MKKILIAAVILSGVLSAREGSTLDVVHLKDGRFLKCQIKAVTDHILTYTPYLPSGGTWAAPAITIRMEGVDYIDFGFARGEEAFLQDLDHADVDRLKRIWSDQYGNLHRPRSRTAKYGLAYAKALLKKQREFDWRTALDVFDRIQQRAWREADRTAARQGRLQALIRLGRLDEASRDARVYARNTEDPGILIEVKYLQAKVEFAQLQKLVEENPKWKEDDEIRPRRNELYNSSIDQFLWPFLFHGTYQEASVRGLMSAAEVYHFSGETDLEKACLEDLKHLYPNQANQPTKEK